MACSGIKWKLGYNSQTWEKPCCTGTFVCKCTNCVCKCTNQLVPRTKSIRNAYLLKTKLNLHWRNILERPIPLKSQFDEIFKFHFFGTFWKAIMYLVTKPFFNLIKGKRFSAVLFTFAWLPLNLHVSEVPKDSQQKECQRLKNSFLRSCCFVGNSKKKCIKMSKHVQRHCCC